MRTFSGNQKISLSLSLLHTLVKIEKSENFMTFFLAYELFKHNSYTRNEIYEQFYTINIFSDPLTGGDPSIVRGRSKIGVREGGGGTIPPSRTTFSTAGGYPPVWRSPKIYF